MTTEGQALFTAVKHTRYVKNIGTNKVLDRYVDLQARGEGSIRLEKTEPAQLLRQALYDVIEFLSK